MEHLFGINYQIKKMPRFKYIYGLPQDLLSSPVSRTLIYQSDPFGALPAVPGACKAWDLTPPASEKTTRSVSVSALWMWEGHGGAQHIPSPFLHPEAWFSSLPHLETSLVAEQEHLFSDQLSPCIYFPSFPTAFPFSHTLTRHWLNCPNFCFLERLWTSGLVFIKP